MPQSDGGASAFNVAISFVIAFALSLLLRLRWLRAAPTLYNLPRGKNPTAAHTIKTASAAIAT